LFTKGSAQPLLYGLSGGGSYTAQKDMRHYSITKMLMQAKTIQTLRIADVIFVKNGRNLFPVSAVLFHIALPI
jgi:hypothetical protein